MQPPGSGKDTSWNRAKSEPMNSTDERMLLTALASSEPMSAALVSIVNSCVSVHSTWAPSERSTSSMRSTSVSRGTFPMTHGPLTRMVAAMIGVAAFFIPPTAMSPLKGLPPRMSKRVCPNDFSVVAVGALPAANGAFFLFSASNCIGI